MGEYEPHDSRRVEKQRPKDLAKRTKWREAEAELPHDEAYEPIDSRHVTQGQEEAAGEPGKEQWRQQEEAEQALDDDDGKKD